MILSKKLETELTASVLKKDPKHTGDWRKCFLTGQNRTKHAHFLGNLFQASYNIKTEKETISGLSLCQLDAGRLAEGEKIFFVQLKSILFNLFWINFVRYACYIWSGPFHKPIFVPPMPNWITPSRWQGLSSYCCIAPVAQLIDGVDIRDFNVGVLRSKLSVVSQEPVLFDCSVRDNVVYGLEDNVPMADIIAACRTANIHDFIAGLPQVRCLTALLSFSFFSGFFFFNSYFDWMSFFFFFSAEPLLCVFYGWISTIICVSDFLCHRKYHLCIALIFLSWIINTNCNWT